MTRLRPGQTFLFQGDSITDAGRSPADDSMLGAGYAAMVAAWHAAAHPECDVTFLNRGVSGNRAKDLRVRWREDCLDLRPDWVSILIGINDTWRRYDSNDPTSIVDYAAAYRDILERTRDTLGARLILMEPFVLPALEDRRAWREDLDPRIHVVRELAREFGALLIPLDGLFARAATHRPPEFWAPDGVHPSPAGHALIAQGVLGCLGSVAERCGRDGR
jgi:lysophospholipase L1-like esterase